jgi:hypothetical protein
MMPHEETVRVHVFAMKGSVADVIVLDDDERAIDTWRDLIEGEASTIAVRCRALLPELRREECVATLAQWLASSDTSRVRLVIVDNFMPLENTGRDLVTRYKTGWVVIASNEPVPDEAVQNPLYLGWVLKARVPELVSRLSAVLDGGCVTKGLIAGLAERGAGVSLGDRFALLKHRLCNAFAPCLFDLRCARDAWYQSGDEAQAWSWLRASLASNDKRQYYQGVLDVARAIAVPERLLPMPGQDGTGATRRASDSLWDVVSECGCESSAAWQRVCALLGVRQSSDGYAIVQNSPITMFCRRLDEAKDGGAAMGAPTHAFFEFDVSNESWGCEDLPLMRTVDDWFGALEDSMMTLRRDIQLHDHPGEYPQPRREREG